MSTQRTIAKGDTVYSQHGQEAEFVAATGGEYIVRPIYEDEDGQHAGDVETWREVFRTPPAPKLDAETAAATERLQALQLEVSELEGKKYAFEREERERRERLKVHDELGDLDRFLSGKITHYLARHQYGESDFTIIPVGETVEDYNSGSEYGMLKLWPSKGYAGTGLMWTVSYRERNSRGDYRSDRVHPCCSEEEAKALAREILSGQLQKELADPKTPTYGADSLVNSCRRWGVEVPSRLVDALTARKRASAVKNRDDLATKLAQADAELAALPGAAA